MESNIKSEDDNGNDNDNDDCDNYDNRKRHNNVMIDIVDSY